MTGNAELIERLDGFQQYRRTQIAEMRPYAHGDDMAGVSVSAVDAAAGSPKPGDMIARNPKNHADKWLVAAQYFADNFAALEPAALFKQEAVAWTGSGSLSALANGNYGHIWPSKADAHPIPLYASPVPAEPYAEGWRPIETARKNGTRILYINKFGNIGHCRWSESYNDGEISCWWDDDHDDECVPRFWMPPLPPAPHGEGA